MSSVDRTHPPARSGPLSPRLPRIERTTLSNGLRVASSPWSATPETLLELTLPGGRAAEAPDEQGLASFVARALTEGTRRHSTLELLDALDFLGADLRAGTDDTSLVLSLRVLDRHLEPALELLGDVLLEPRFDAESLERVRKQRLASIATRGDEAARVAHHVWDRLVHGADSPLGRSALGTEATVRSFDDARLRRFHSAALDPRAAQLAVVGRWAPDELRARLEPLARRWSAPKGPVSPQNPTVSVPTAPGLYVVDRPDAPQTELRLGHLSVAATHADALALSALNYPLGGVFTSRINLELREKKGYTYGARSDFELAPWPAPFTVGAAVQAQHTADSITTVRTLLEQYLAGPTQTEVDFTRDSLEQSLARQFETPASRLAFVRRLQLFGWPDDYPLLRLRQLVELGPPGLAALAQRHLRPSSLIVLAVGDARQLASLGSFTLLDLDGAPLPAP